MSQFRRYGRKPLKYLVELTHKCAGILLVETDDVSETGMFIRSPNLRRMAAVGEKIKAIVYVEGSDAKKEKAELRIVRLTQDGVGLSFD